MQQLSLEELCCTITVGPEDPQCIVMMWDPFAWQWCEQEGLEGIAALAALCGLVPWVAGGDDEVASRMYAWIAHKATA